MPVPRRRGNLARMDKKIYIHAGAHRTGTSSLQMCLAENADTLQRLGYDLAYPTRDGAPGRGLALRLPRPRDVGAKGLSLRPFIRKTRNELDQISPDATRALILSEENIPGPMRSFYAGKFLPAASLRAHALRRALPNPPAHVLFVTRSYDALFVSAYRKRAEDNASRPFAELRDTLATITGGWVDVITALRDDLKPAQLTVLDYAARGSSPQLLTRLIPDLAGTDLHEPARTVNLSATDKALEILQKRYHAGEELSRPEWQSVIAKHSDTREDRGFAAFTPEQAQTLQSRYANDLDQIETLDGVTLIRG